MALTLMFQVGFSQSDTTIQEDEYFTVRGLVREELSYQPIIDATIQVNGGSYVTTSYDGNFRVKVKIGDQLIISHKNFITVFHTIKSDDRLIIEVQQQQKNPSQKDKRKRKVEEFIQLIDSADNYLKRDAERSIQFIADALDKSTSQSQNAEAYETLGDLYVFWKQYDLAITNYKIALQNKTSNSLKLKLAQAYMLDENYSESIQVYNRFDANRLSNYQKTEYYEGLGDVLLKQNNTNGAITNYQKGLLVATNNNIAPKITDFNSKIAQGYNMQGDTQQAETFFKSSLSSAENESKQRSLEEKVTVAEFNNVIQNYDDEISLRKEVIEDLKEIEKDSIVSNASPLSPQKQNYKIGNALILQKNFDEAIPFLDKSIAEADKREDLETKNDALRKKVDAYENLGEYDKAKLAFEDFVASVDELYIKKLQEIAQNARLTRSISESQNRITSLENDRELNRKNYELTIARNKNQQIVIYSLIGGFLLIFIAAFFTYKYIKEQKLANNLLALKSLRSQMNPHFIFNALNSVNSFIASNDERTANKYLSDFSFLMRAVLENSEEDFIPLKKEIELLELYTKLEHFRFKDKFDYSIEIDEKIDIEAFEIPPMLLQPYIENAVWHGLRYKEDKGILKVNIEPLSSEEISITIIDDGVGRKRSKALKTDNQKKHKSKGLSNIKERIQILNTMYQDRVAVVIEDYRQTEDVGTKVIVTLKKD
ncbi:histidine kinase [Winogradskyella sp.]|uniref:histidine kinase n=1 Tax=Winogradskyella sp. TaxID=1883156 RepID=UPI0025F34BFB|nr:histidine kinase [Winogradskyella sp.]